MSGKNGVGGGRTGRSPGATPTIMRECVKLAVDSKNAQNDFAHVMRYSRQWQWFKGCPVCGKDGWILCSPRKVQCHACKRKGLAKRADGKHEAIAAALATEQRRAEAKAAHAAMRARR